MMSLDNVLSNKYMHSAGLIAAYFLALFRFKTSVDPKLLSAMNIDGYCILPDFFSENICNMLVECFDEREPLATVFDNDRRIFGMEKISDLHQHLFADSVYLKSIGDAHVGAPQILIATMAAKLYAAPDKLGSGGGWHRDSFLPQYKAICYLTDVSEKNGPFEYVPGSHRLIPKVNFGLKAVTRDCANSTRYTQESIDEYCRTMGVESKFFVAKKGTVILCDTSGLHRGRPIMEGIRYALTNYYKSPRFFLDRRARKGKIYAYIDDTIRAMDGK